MGTTYPVLIQGVKPTKDVDAVRESISKLFKVSSDVARLLEAKGRVVKGGRIVERAAQYHAAIEAAGANCVIEPEATSFDDGLRQSDRL